MKNIALFDRYLKKTMSKEDVEALKKILKTKEGRKSFVRYADETVQIVHSSKQIDTIDEEDTILNELVHRSEENLLRQLTNVPPHLEFHPQKSSDSKPAKPYHYYYLFVLGAAASVLLYILNMNEPVEIERQAPVVDKASPVLIKSVARVTGLKGVANVQLNDWLKPGAVKLTEGEIEITFDSGAVVLLQGKAEFKLESAVRAFLSSGKVTARVPQEAKGFIISTPQGTVVDLGTEFALSVQEDEAMEVHVLEGEVEAGSVQWDNPKLIKKNEGVRIDDKGEMSLTTLTKANQFTRVHTSSSDINLKYVHWAFDEKINNRVKDSGNGAFGKHYGLNLDTGGLIDEKGKYGRSLYLNGQGKFATSEFRGIGGSKARTVAFWLRVPPDSSSENYYSIVAWGALGPSEKWQIACNPNPANGTVGAIRTEFSNGYIVGTTDLRDGSWHHIVSIFIGGEAANVATHIKHYVDGELEAVSGYLPRKVSTKISGPEAQPVSIGKYINHDDWYFRGSLDEFYIFEGALTPSQISLLRDNRLMKNNK